MCRLLLLFIVTVMFYRVAAVVLLQIELNNKRPYIQCTVQLFGEDVAVLLISANSNKTDK